MPPFDQDKGDMDAYLKRFERYEENLKWPREEWAVNLSAPLRGNRRKCFEFAIRLDNYLTRWIELSKVEESFDGLKDLLLREQFRLPQKI